MTSVSETALFPVLIHLLKVVICSNHQIKSHMMDTGHVPECFGQSYTVPIPKASCNAHSKSVTVNDFRGISISPIISKVLEHCILDRYRKFFETNDSQFGFKKDSGCSHPLYTLRCVTDYFISHGSTVNLCALDVSKAFDKMNHHGLFVKLMDRRIPNGLLLLLENWFKIGVTCVKWANLFSVFYEVPCGIRQGGVLSPYLFAVYIDSVAEKVRAKLLGCHIKMTCLSIILYADDILLLAPSINALQKILHVCEKELDWLDLTINVSKSSCMRIGPRFKAHCSNIVSIHGHEINWSNSIRYLGVYLTANNVYSCSFSHAKRSFYRSFNAIFGRVGRVASEEVVVELMKKKCLPILYYAIEVCPLNKAHINSLDFAVGSCFSKIFCIKSRETITECMRLFNCQSVKDVADKRRLNFIKNYSASFNSLYKLFS